MSESVTSNTCHTITHAQLQHHTCAPYPTATLNNRHILRYATPTGIPYSHPSHPFHRLIRLVLVSECQPECESCVGTTSSDCTSCNPGYFLMTDTCVRKCSESYVTSLSNIVTAIILQQI